MLHLAAMEEKKHGLQSGNKTIVLQLLVRLKKNEKNKTKNSPSTKLSSNSEIYVGMKMVYEINVC